MKYALLFRENEPLKLVSAEDVKNGLYDRYDEFVDPEYEFKVQFVKSSRNNGAAYFRFYYSYEEYKKLYPDRATIYEIVSNMRHYKESVWHKNWKDRVADFCDIEKTIHDKKKNKWKFADAYYDKTKTCIEFQHSYIALDFEERNKFYSDLHINTIWLYNLPTANTSTDAEGNVEILEDNSKGFFRISENHDNLKNQLVYIQVKTGMIYRVKELLRRDSSIDKKSTIRYFKPSEIYTTEEFIEAIKFDKIKMVLHTQKEQIKNQVLANGYNYNSGGKSLYKLWKSNYKWIKVINIERGDEIIINCDDKGKMFVDFATEKIEYIYADNKYGNRSWWGRKKYYLSTYEANRPIWRLIAKKDK